MIGERAKYVYHIIKHIIHHGAAWVHHSYDDDDDDMPFSARTIAGVGFFEIRSIVLPDINGVIGSRLIELRVVVIIVRVGGREVIGSGGSGVGVWRAADETGPRADVEGVSITV